MKNFDYRFLLATLLVVVLGGCAITISPLPVTQAAPTRAVMQPRIVEVAAGKPTTASAYWNHSDLAFPPNGIVDRQTDESGNCVNGGRDTHYWLLPDQQAGWVQVDLQKVYPVVKLRWLNVHNGRCGNDRATTKFHVATSQIGEFSGEELIVYSGEMTYALSPSFKETTLSQTILTRYVRFYVDTYSGGGGLNELEVYAEVSAQ